MMSVVVGAVEDECRRVCRDVEKQFANAEPSNQILREMAMVLDHIDQVRERNAAVDRWCLEKNLFADTQIMNIRSRSRIVANWVVETQMVNDCMRLRDNADWKRLQSAADTTTQLQKLQKRLLELWNMHVQLYTPNGGVPNPWGSEQQDTAFPSSERMCSGANPTGAGCV
jgi:hypothetical protein